MVTMICEPNGKKRLAFEPPFLVKMVDTNGSVCRLASTITAAWFGPVLVWDPATRAQWPGSSS